MTDRLVEWMVQHVSTDREHFFVRRWRYVEPRFEYFPAGRNCVK